MLQAELKKRTPLPRRKDAQHFMQYAETCELAEIDERDMPSAKGKMPMSMLQEKKAADKKLKPTFVNSKIRDAVICDECGRPRLIYSMNKPSDKEYESLASYKETVDYTCGSALF
eukprot:3412421-Prymnesium_polylepis.1